MENNLINTVITSMLTALEQHIKELVTQQVTAVLAAQPKPETEAVVDMDKLRALVAPIVESQVEAAVEQAIDAHCSDYDHDEYDSVVRNLNDYDFDYFVTKDDINAKVEEVVDDRLDDKIEDKARELLRNASISIDV